MIIGMDPHMRSATIEARNAREVLRATGTFPDRYRRISGDAAIGPALAAAHLGGGGRERGRPAGRAAGSSPMVNGYWMCRRNWPPGPGCSTSGRAARPMPPTRTRWSWRRCGSGLRELSVDDELVVLRSPLRNKEVLSALRNH